MQAVTRIITLVFISLFLVWLSSSIDKGNGQEIIKNLEKEHIVIHLPKAYMWVGCLDVFTFGIFMIFMANDQSGTAVTWVWILFCFFVLLGVFLIAVTKIWKIEIFRHKEYFLYRTAFCRVHKVQYSQCVSYKFKTNNLVLKTEKRTFYVDNKATNFEFLLIMLSQHKVKEIE